MSSVTTSVEHASVNLMLALNHITTLKEWLEMMEDDVDIESVMEHIDALQVLLSGPKKLEVNFSKLNEYHLQKLGVIGKRLYVNTDRLATLVVNMAQRTKEEINLLKNQLVEICAHAYISNDIGSNMILHAILLSLGRIVHSTQPNMDVAILPELKIKYGDGIQIKNPISDYELCLNGTIDYGIVQYTDEGDNKEWLLDSNGHWLLELSSGHFLLAEAKYRSIIDGDITLCMPKAIGQAIAWANATGQKDVHICLSDGWKWKFCILQLRNDQWIYYESVLLELSESNLQDSGRTFFQIIQLMIEWLSPSDTQLYELLI